MTQLLGHDFDGNYIQRKKEHQWYLGVHYQSNINFSIILCLDNELSVDIWKYQWPLRGILRAGHGTLRGMC